MTASRVMPAILGTLAAAALGAFAAIEFDRITEVMAGATTAAGRTAALQTGLMLVMGGLTAASAVWIAIGLVVRAAAAPYDALAERLERLAIGDARTALPPVGRAPGAQRLARAVAAIRTRLIEQDIEMADLHARNDRLGDDMAEERRMLLEMIVDQMARLGHIPGAAPRRERPRPDDAFAVNDEFDIPDGPDDDFPGLMGGRLINPFATRDPAARGSRPGRPSGTRHRSDATPLESWSTSSLNATWHAPRPSAPLG